MLSESEHAKKIIFDQIYKEIFEIDQMIRYIGTYHNGDLRGKMRPGVESYLDEAETVLSLSHAVRRWNERMDLSPKIGRPIYSTTLYQNVKRITLEISEDLIILVSTEIECDHEKLILKLINFKKRIHEILEIPR